MNIAIIGVRGIPACYGGFDTFVEELATRLVKYDNVNLTVFCRSNYYKKKLKEYKGVRLKYFPAPRIKMLESLLHSFICSLYLVFCKYHIVYFVDEGNAPFCALHRLLGKMTVLHTDGLGWKRKKWGGMAKMYYRFAAWLCSKTAHFLITDNPALKTFYKKAFNANSYYIAYGAESPYGYNDEVLKKYHLEKKRYLLVVSRLVQENNVDIIVREFVKSKSIFPLVVIGDNPYDLPYVDLLKSCSDDRVVFIGAVYNQDVLNSFYKNAFVYIHGHEVGGTNPSLLRAMGNGTTPLVINVPYNKTVIEECGMTFNKSEGNLSEMINYTISHQEQVDESAKKTQRRAREEYTWEAVAEKHIKVFHTIQRYRERCAG